MILPVKSSSYPYLSFPNFSILFQNSHWVSVLTSLGALGPIICFFLVPFGSSLTPLLPVTLAKYRRKNFYEPYFGTAGIYSPALIISTLAARCLCPPSPICRPKGENFELAVLLTQDVVVFFWDETPANNTFVRA